MNLRTSVAVLAATCALLMGLAPAAALSAEPETEADSSVTMACSIRERVEVPNVRHCMSLGSAQRCRAEARLASQPSQERIDMRIDNRSDEQILIYWLSFAGERKLYRALPPGGAWKQSTYLGHNWLVMTADGHCVGIFNAAPMAWAFY